MNKKRIDFLFINPSAEGNSCRYDYNLLSNISLGNKGYITNVKYDAPIIPNVYSVPIFRYLGKKGIMKGLSYVWSLLKLSLFIFTYKPLILHINWIRMPYLEYVYYSVLRRLFNFKLIYTAHNVLPHDTGDKYKIIYTKFYNMANAIIVHSKSTHAEIEQLGINGSKIHVVKHGVIDMSQIVHGDIFDFRNKYKLEEKIIFSMSGLQSHYKGTDLAIQAWLSKKELYNSENCCLVLMGKSQGIDYSNAEKCKNILIINRFFTEEEHISLFNSTDVLLLPYRDISQSGVLLTALPYKIPIIASNVGGLGETMDEANIGWKVEVGNFLELSEIMKKIVESPEMITQIKTDKQEWDKILKYYSWEEIGNKTQSLYLSLLDNYPTN